MDSNSDSDSDSDSDHSNSNWQDITLDLLLKIHSFLDSRIDRLRFRSICKSWRSSTPKPFPSPNPNLTYYRIPAQHRLIGNPPLILVQSEIYHLFDPSRRSFVSSVVAVEECKNGKMQAWHPIADKKLSDCPKVLDMTNFGVVQVGKLYHLKHMSCDGSEIVDYTRVVTSLIDDKVAEMKMILGGINLSFARISNIRVMCIFEKQLMCYIFWKGLKWKKIMHSGPWFPYIDVIYRKGKFYAVDETRRLVIVDTSMKVEVVNSPDVLSAGLMINTDTTYLVNFNGELHLVVLYYGEKEDIRDPFNTKFLIYRYVEEEKDWVRVMSLGNWAFFVSRCSSFSVLTSESSLCKKNCIYFQMDIHTESSSFEKGSVCFTAVFDLAKGYCDDFATNFNSPGSVVSFNFA